MPPQWSTCSALAPGARTALPLREIRSYVGAMRKAAAKKKGFLSLGVKRPRSFGEFAKIFLLCNI